MKYCGGVSCNPSTTTNSSSATQTLINNASSQQVCTIVTNGAGMASEKICSSEYKVDTENPSVGTPTVESSTSLSNGWYSEVSIKATGSDTASGVASMKYCTTTDSLCTPSTDVSGTSATATLSASTNGYRACFSAVDTSGRITTTPVCSGLYKIDTEVPNVSSVSVTTLTSTSITVSVNASDNHSKVATYYYKIGNGSYISSANSTYTFSNLTKGTSYTISVYVVDNAGRQSISKTTTALTPIATSGTNFAVAIKSLYISDGTNGLYYHDGSGTYTNANLEAGDNSYRFTGADENVNNYVCFGNDTETCPNENLYRIIGVFGSQVKLIKWDYATSDMLGTITQNSIKTPSETYYKGNLSTLPYHYWSGTDSTSSNNIWSESTMNMTTFNINYLNYLDADDPKWRNMIATTEWQQGGMTWVNGSSSSTAKVAYNYELGANKTTGTFTTDCNGYDSGTTLCTYNATTNAKVGLMYVSEYYYAASPTYWSYLGYGSATTDYRAATSSNWMYMGVYEWTITRRADLSYRSFSVNAAGYMSNYTVYDNYAVRPSFNLESTVKYVSGTGAKNSPFRISS